MPYTPPYIPRADASFRTFAENFCQTINDSPSMYMITPAEAAWLMQALQRFQTALQLSSNPETRTRITIADKDDARSTLRDLIQNHAAFIRPNLGITDGDKLAVGVRPRNITRNKRTAPDTVPLLNYIGSLPGVDQLVYHDSNRPHSKAKPRGVERLELWVAYSKVGSGGGPGDVAGPPPRPSHARLVGSFKKSKMLVHQDRQRDSRLEGDGKPTYWGRWVGFDGTVGPWSLACGISGTTRTVQGANATAKSSAVVDEQSSVSELRKAA